jgi:hypothetical protein
MLSNAVMDVYEIRRRNLDVLLAETESLKAIGDAIRLAKQKIDPAAAERDYANVLSQIKGGKHMGAKLARDVEAGMGKPQGWMDTAQFQIADEAMEAKEAGQLAMNMKPEDRDHWLKTGRLLAQNNPKRGPGNPFGNTPKGGTQ